MVEPEQRVSAHIEARAQDQAQDQVEHVADLRAAGERDLLSEAQVILVDNLREHGVSTSVPIEVEDDDDGNGVILEDVPINIDDDEDPAAEVAPPP